MIKKDVGDQVLHAGKSVFITRQDSYILVVKFKKESEIRFMKILAKSALTKEQINAKVEKHADGIEIQLLSELIDGKIGHYHFAKDVYDLDNLKKYDIYCVHAPILSFYDYQM